MIFFKVSFLWKPPSLKKCKLLLGTSQNIAASWDKRTEAKVTVITC
jgi:hypothetical protein